MDVVVIAHNIRSTHNVGSILRTADGFGVSRVYLTGYSPFPELPGDSRLPHLRDKLTKQISKTALGAESWLAIEHRLDPIGLMSELKTQGYQVVGLEQSLKSQPLQDFKPSRSKLALLIGEEVNGIEPELLEQCEAVVEIPMFGQKESFNVSVATGIALYEICGKARYTTKHKHATGQNKKTVSQKAST